jgi:hypothetical protein
MRVGRIYLGAAVFGCSILVGQSALAQCKRDIDCKGTRVCSGGQCVDQAAPPAAAPAPAPVAAPAPQPQPQPQPGYAPQPQPGYAPQPQPGYAPQPQPGYAPQPQPGYAPQPQPGYAPQPQPGYAPQPQPGYAQPYPPQQPGYAQPYPPQQQPGGYAQAEQAAPPTGPQIKTFSFVPRLGAQLGGSGSYSSSCDGTMCSSIPTSSTDYSAGMAFAFSADFLFKIGNLFRMGPGLMYTHTMDAEADMPNAQSEEWGSLTNFDFVAELVPKVGEMLWLVPRFKVGLSMLNVTGAAADVETARRDNCASGLADGCESLKSPHFGLNVGTGFGVMFAVGPVVRLRFDALGEYFRLSMSSVSYGGSTYSEAASGLRFLMLGGMEI